MKPRTTALLYTLVLLAACGGGNPLDNPPLVDNPSAANSARKLSFAYFQRCIQPIFETPLPIVQNGVTSVNTCASAGCHADATGTGGALRLVAGAPTLSLADPANTAAVLRASAMYRNFYTSQGSAIPGSPDTSRLLTKPLVQGVLHGGGLVFDNASVEAARRIAYWISHPMPTGQDEFSTAGNALFTPQDAEAGACNNP
jgi:hypothetical protein